MTGRWSSSNRRSQLPPDWERRRRRQLKADGHRCTRCHSTERLEVHHAGDRDDHDDLATLCHDCHATETNKQAAAARKPKASARRPPPPHPGLRSGG